MSSILTLTTQDKCDDYREDAFYPTPWDASEAPLMAEEEWLRKFHSVDEPACGDGAMAEVIRGWGKTVHATDLVYRGYGTGGMDFLDLNRKRTSDCLFTNPPFSDNEKNPMAEPFIRQAHRLGYEYIGMILKANYWHAAGRIPLFREFRPVRIRPYSWRIDFTGTGRNHFDCIFVVWMPSAAKTTEYCNPMERPKHLSQPSLFGIDSIGTKK